MAPNPLIGKKAPEFSAPNYTGETFTFTPGASGHPVALFFYPKSGSYGCTKEACHFRDALTEKDVFKSNAIEVIGVSPDSVEKQKAFVEKNKLTYPILSDAKGEVRKLYGVSKGLLGLSESGRVTFVIGADGIVKDAMDSTLNFGAHSKFVTTWLAGLAKKEPTKDTKAADSAPAATPAAAESTPAAIAASESAAPTSDAPTNDAPTTDTPAPAEATATAATTTTTAEPTTTETAEPAAPAPISEVPAPTQDTSAAAPVPEATPAAAEPTGPGPEPSVEEEPRHGGPGGEGPGLGLKGAI
ncbi:AhpC-TSA-domain-containing protein [Rickenella mellea]|uniref:thioredoxin-dependent peroxiredoxin n=1 Tax=Rickenella mellea TaxID=50990 RepID=A0A4Y7PS73_9AGAM|nr:AhpC-TSA-domain-containing protein [Rickenella mellea]